MDAINLIYVRERHQAITDLSMLNAAKEKDIKDYVRDMYRSVGAQSPGTKNQDAFVQAIGGKI